KKSVDGFGLWLECDDSGSYTVKAEGVVNGQRATYYDGPLPSGVAAGPWNTLLIVTYQDNVAFFIDGQYLASDQGVSLLGGTMGLGVYPGTTADFSNLQIRDLK